MEKEDMATARFTLLLSCHLEFDAAYPQQLMYCR